MFEALRGGHAVFSIASAPRRAGAKAGEFTAVADRRAASLMAMFRLRPEPGHDLDQTLATRAGGDAG
jgi:hypothetical protein